MEILSIDGHYRGPAEKIKMSTTPELLKAPTKNEKVGYRVGARGTWSLGD